MNTAAAAPIAAPRASRVSLIVISVLASSISSRMITCARSVTSWTAATTSRGCPSGSVAKALEDQGGQQATGECGTDLHLGALGSRGRLRARLRRRGRHARRAVGGRRRGAGHLLLHGLRDL